MEKKVQHCPGHSSASASFANISISQLLTETIMSEMNKQPACTEKTHTIRSQDLPLSCPMDDMILWNAHPKVYLPIEHTGREICPYCGTTYVLVDD